jgi:hypothetical protein
MSSASATVTSPRPEDTDQDVKDRIAQVERGYVLEEHGLYVTRDLTPAEWIDIGRALARQNQRLHWQIGDWLAAGGRQKARPATVDAPRDEWGRIVPGHQVWERVSVYGEAAEITGYAPGTLAGLYMVATAFPRGERFPDLSWSHHREATRVKDPEQRRAIMESALAARWTRDDMVREVDKVVPRPQEAEAPGVPHKVQRRIRARRLVKCPECQHVFDVKNHKVAGTAEAGGRK